MTTFLDALIRWTAPIAEAGLTGMDEALRSTQKVLSRAVGEPVNPATAPPTERPRNVDEATSELANRLLRTALRTPWRLDALPEAGRQALDASLKSFPLPGFHDPRRWLGLPLQLPLAISSLVTQEALRGLAAAQAVPARLMPDFLDFVVEVFTDLHVYFSLQYQDELRSYQQKVERDPKDHRSRFGLARTYLKCGLYPQALAELEILGREPGWRRRALYESLIANYRAGETAAAIHSGARCLELDPSHERTRFWLWLAAEKAGGYPPEVGPELRMEARDGHRPIAVTFEDIASKIGLDKTSGGRGSAVFDAHGDGRLDVAFAGAHAGVSLFRNDGQGEDGLVRFTDVSTGSGLDRCVYGFGLAAGDYDNNGRVDLYVSSLGFFNGQGALMRNDGVGDDGQVSFTDVTAEAGLADWGPGFAATWVDYDNDGWLDLFIAHNLGGLFDRKTPNRLFRNNRDGTFTDVTDSAGIRTRWTTIGAAWGDFRNCGLPDLFVSSLGRSQLFRNNGDGTFTDVSRQAGVDRPANGSVALVCDIDDDGWLDIVQLTYSRPDDAIRTLRTGQGPPDGQPLRIYRNNRDGSFTNIAPELGITGCWGTMSANAGDVDNDGRIDLFLGNGDPSMDRTEASILLRNAGGRFDNVTFSAGLPPTGKGHGANLADLAGDGRLHLIVASGGLYPGDLLTNSVYRPVELPGNYLNVRLVGTTSNRDAIGARLALDAAGRIQHRVVSGGSFFGCLPFEQHFGLGQTAADALEIRWPSGLVQRFGDLPVNATIRIREGKEGFEHVYARGNHDD